MMEAQACRIALGVQGPYSTNVNLIAIFKWAQEARVFALGKPF